MHCLERIGAVVRRDTSVGVLFGAEPGKFH